MSGHPPGTPSPRQTPDTTSDPASPAISQDRMRRLLHDGHAAALLADCFPVPATYAGTWWHIPTDHPAQHYLPAPPEHAARYAQLANRRQLAHSAITAADQPPPARAR